MNREYHRWYSPHLGRDMELLVFGHAGAKVLVFPTRDGRFYEYENLRMTEVLRHKLEAGQLQLYCVDSIDWESFYCHWAHPEGRIRRHQAFEDYILHEVLPLMASKNGHPCTIAHGCSFGAFHAANLAFRHPHLFQKLSAFSGRYDPTLNVESFRDLLDGFRSDDVYYHCQAQFLPGLNGWRLEALRGMDIVLVIGRDDPFLDNNRHISRILWDKGVWHAFHEWGERAHSGYYWHRSIYERARDTDHHGAALRPAQRRDAAPRRRTWPALAPAQSHHGGLARVRWRRAARCPDHRSHRADLISPNVDGGHFNLRSCAAISYLTALGCRRLGLAGARSANVPS